MNKPLVIVAAASGAILGDNLGFCDNVHRLTGPVGIVAIVLAVVIIIAFLLSQVSSNFPLRMETQTLCGVAILPTTAYST